MCTIYKPLYKQTRSSLIQFTEIYNYGTLLISVINQLISLITCGLVLSAIKR